MSLHAPTLFCLFTAHKKNVLSQFSFSEKVCSIHSVHKYMHTYTHCITHTCKVMVPPDNGFALEPVFEMSLLLARSSLTANNCQLAKSVSQLYLWRPIKLSPLYSVISFVSFITHKFSHSIQRNGFWGLNCVSIWFYHCLKWGQSGPQCGHHIYPCCIELHIYFWEWRLIGTGLLWSLL